MTVEDGTGGGAASNNTNGGTQEHQQEQQQQVGKLGEPQQLRVEEAPAGAATGPPAVCANFAQFSERYPIKAKRLCRQVSEVTGIVDEGTITQAFDRSRRNPQGEFNVSVAIEWILDSANQLADSGGVGASAIHLPNSPKVGHQQQQVAPIKRPLAASAANPGLPSNAAAMPPAVAMDRPTSSAVAPETAQPPNSPVQSAGAVPAAAGPSCNKALVDLTESNKPNVASEDADIEKAIKLSLQEAQQSSSAAAAATAGNFGGSTMSQEDQDVSRALEASLLETQMNGAKRKRGETWVDPLNPHERERDGMVSKISNACRVCFVIWKLD